MSNIEKKIITIIVEKLKIKEDSVSLESKFVDDLGADSLDLVELMMEFEEAFDCDIPDEEATKLTSVADAVEYVKKHMEA